ncbi:MAG TPA: DUF1570 domain-containing protein [Pirellulaceae bacterium]|nr:DUF1570 domain-containing protein [Pirellulaceae bacterium]
MLVALCQLVATLASAAPTPPDRAPLDAAYQQALEQLATRCDALKLPEQAALTRAWFIRRLPDRQYLFLPPDRAPVELPASAPELVRKWQAKFLELRRAQASELFDIAKSYLAAQLPTPAYQALFETLREDPDHAAARAILGYTKINGVWRFPGGSPAATKAKLAHGYLKLPPGGYWRITTPHYQIVTSAGTVPGLQFGERLETLHLVWRQAFFTYWSDLAELQRDFTQPTKADKPLRRYDVVLFKHRAEYLDNLAAAEPRLAVTQGIYLDKKQTAYFYQGDDRAEATCAHEATHQLFQEVGHVAPELGSQGNFWIVEGVALYMESLRQYDGYVTLGGWDADRLQFARHHLFNGQYQLPLAKLVSTTRPDLQSAADIKRIYSQSAGLAHYLLDAEGGKFRAATTTYLAQIYAGRDDARSLAALSDLALEQHDAAYRDFMKVSDADVEQLPSPERIRNLCLGHQAISDASMTKLAMCAPLRWLDLAATQVTDAGVAKLAPLRELRQLNLEQTAIGDATLAIIANWKELYELDLSQTRLTDQGLAALAANSKLEVLWLTGTRLSDASLPTLKKLTKLTTLDLEGTEITPDGRQTLHTALPHWKP